MAATARSVLIALLTSPHFIYKAESPELTNVELAHRLSFLLWNSVPDALASIANYLSKRGWQRNRDWGFEVSIPANVSCAQEGPDLARPVADWAKMGITRISGKAFPAWKDNLFAGALILTHLNRVELDHAGADAGMLDRLLQFLLREAHLVAHQPRCLLR